MISENSRDYIDVIEKDSAIINNEISKNESDHTASKNLDIPILPNHVSSTDKSDKNLVQNECQLSNIESSVCLEDSPSEPKFIEHPLGYLFKRSAAFIKRWRKTETDERAVDPVIETVAILLGGAFIFIVFIIIIILLL